jgi:hypothetical protein
LCSKKNGVGTHYCCIPSERKLDKQYSGFPFVHNLRYLPPHFSDTLVRKKSFYIQVNMVLIKMGSLLDYCAYRLLAVYERIIAANPPPV